MSKPKNLPGPKNGGTYVEKVKACWNPAPDWVLVLAQRVDAASARGEGQKDVAKALGLVNATLISSVLSNSYKGRHDKIEAAVRGAFMSATVECPVLGVIGRDACAGHQGRKFSAASPQAAQLFHACRVCPNMLGGKS